MDSTILRQEVYEFLQTGEPFDMEFVTCHRKKGTGGELVRVENWLVCGKEQETPDFNNAPLPGPVAPIQKQSKDPHHGEWGTVNVFNPANSGLHPITVHLDLIQFFNGKRVIN